MKPDSPIVELAKKTAKSIVDHGSIPMATLKESIKLHDKVDALVEEVKKKEQLDFILDDEVIERLKGEKGEKGDVGLRGESGTDGKQGEKGERGEKGDAGENGADGKNGLNGLDGSPDTAEQIADKLNTLEGKVDASVIRGLEKLLQGGDKVEGGRVYGTRLLRNLIDVIGAKEATDGQVLTKQADGTFAFETPSSGGSLTKGIVEVDFGDYTTYNDIATVSVVDATITATSYPSVSLYAVATADHDPDDYMAEGLIPYVTNVQAGVGFDVSVRAPSLSWGKYMCTYQF